MKPTLRIQKKSKRRRAGRRSQSRLGARPKTTVETSIPRAVFAIKPAKRFWKINGSRMVGIMVLAFLLWVLYLMFDMDDFYIVEAEIEGNRILSSEEIYVAAQIQDLSVFWIDPETVADNVAALPNIKQAEVYVTLPANVTIHVEERQPEIIWHTGGRTWWIDNEGTFVPPRAETGVEEDRLEIVDVDDRAIQVNDKIDVNIVRGAQMIRSHKPELMSLQYSRIYGLAYSTAEGWPVYLGRSTEIPAKLLVADAMIRDLVTRQVVPSFIDVRNPLRAVYQEAEPEGF